MNTENGRDGLASGRHIDESGTPGFITMTVLHHVRRFHPAKPFKHLAKIVPRNIARQIPYMNIHSVPLIMGIEPLCFKGTLSKEK
jgi:hypothetical protein